MWIVIRADKKTKQTEAWYMKYLIDNLREIEGAEKALEDFASRVNYSDEKILQELSSLDVQVKHEIYEAACIASVVDRDLSKEEEELLKKLADVCNREFNKKEILKLSKQFS